MTSLRIAVDVTPIREGGECGGAKPFVLELLEGLATASRRHQYQLLTTAENDDAFARYDRLGMTRRRVDGVAPPIGLRAAGTDLLFCPMTAPTYAESGVRTISTLYDLQHFAYPWFFDDHERAHRSRFYDDLTRRVDHVVCISEFSRINMIRRLGVPPERTSVVPIAIHERLQPCAEQEAWSRLAGAPLPRCRFAFYPANSWPHKNHRLLLVAFGRFLTEHPESDLHLVLTGEMIGEGKMFQSAIDRMALASRVHVLGFVPEAQLAALWSVAAFLVFPSLFEGFGIPLTEAMYFGKPMLCSREGSLPEVGGDEAFYFDPRNPQSIVDALALTRQWPEDMDQRIDRARVRLDAYRPAAVVEQYLDVFDRTAAPRRSHVLQTSQERDEQGRLISPFEAYARYWEDQDAGGTDARLDEIDRLKAHIKFSEDDRAARLEVIERQGAQLGRIPALEAALAFSEDDRAARLEVIERQRAEFEAALAFGEADRAARLEVIERQGAELGRIPALEAALVFSEADRAARLDLIQQQGAALDRQREELHTLRTQWRARGRLERAAARLRRATAGTSSPSRR